MIINGRSGLEFSVNHNAEYLCNDIVTQSDPRGYDAAAALIQGKYNQRRDFVELPTKSQSNEVCITMMICFSVYTYIHKTVLSAYKN